MSDQLRQIIDALGNIRWYNEYGKFHREDGPAVEYVDGSIAWYQNGRLHREDGPAVIWKDGHEEWWINGKEVDPFVMFMNGAKLYD